MKNINSKFNKLSIGIFILFTTAIISTFIPESFPDFFGDKLCIGRSLVKGSDGMLAGYSGCGYGDLGSHEPTYHWGWRHWLWSFMGLALFIVQCVRIGFDLTTPPTEQDKL